MSDPRKTVELPSIEYRVKVAAAGTRQGKRGRPAKASIPPTAYGRIAFAELPDGPIENPEKLAEWFRQYVQKRPHLDDGTGDLAAWLGAAAAALEAGDAARVGWYCLNALRAQYLAAMGERLNVPGVAADTRLRELADVGAKKLRSDKRRGHRGRW